MDLMPQVQQKKQPENIEDFEEIVTSPKSTITQEEIFSGLSPRISNVRGLPVTEEINEITEEENTKPILQETVKPEKVKKKRKPMSEEHKLKLAGAREKALATRRANAKQKKEIKELHALKKHRDLEDLRKSVLGDPTPPPPKVIKVVEDVIVPVEIKTNAEKTYTKKELIEAQQHAVIQYEKIRLDKKQHKKKLQEEENRINLIREEKESILKKNIKRATQPIGRTSFRNSDRDYWDNCL